MRAKCLGLYCLAVLLIAGCSRPTKAEGRAENTTSDPPVVAVAKAAPEDLSRGIVMTAEFLPYQEIEVMAKVAGYVKQINVDVGDRVHEGQVLATLDVPEMSDEITRASAAVDRSNAEATRSRDEIARAEATHEMFHVTYKRLADVAGKRPGLIAQQEVDDAHSKDVMAEAQLAAAKSALSASQQAVAVTKAELGKSRTMNGYTRVTAPFSGVITKRFANTGSMIQAGTSSQTQAMPVVRLSQNSLLRLLLPVPESAVPRVKIGEPVEVRVPTLGRTFAGRVARFTDRVQTNTRTMETEVDVANPNLVLVPGMYAEVDLTIDRRPDALAVPVAAVDPDSETQAGVKTGRVLVVTDDGRIEPRKIELGLETANRVEVKTGIHEGEMVVLGNRASLHAGERVKPKPVTMTIAKDGQ